MWEIHSASIPITTVLPDPNQWIWFYYRWQGRIVHTFGPTAIQVSSAKTLLDMGNVIQALDWAWMPLSIPEPTEMDARVAGLEGN